MTDLCGNGQGTSSLTLRERSRPLAPPLHPDRSGTRPGNRGVIGKEGHMNFDRYLKAALLGFAVTAVTASQSGAQSLKVMEGEASSALRKGIWAHSK